MSLRCGSCGCGRDEKKLKHEDETGSDLKAEDGESDGEPEYDSDDWRTWPDRDVFIKYYQQLDESDGKERTVTEIVKLNAGCPRDFAYYITFKIDNEGKEETFQAKVERTIERTLQVPICRRKV